MTKRKRLHLRRIPSIFSFPKKGVWLALVVQLKAPISHLRLMQSTEHGTGCFPELAARR